MSKPVSPPTLTATAAPPTVVATPVLYLRFIDYVVGSSLQTCSRGLLLVSQSGSLDLSLNDARNAELKACALRLMAAWQLVRKCVGKAQYQRSAARISELLALFPEPMSFGLVAQDLLDRADQAAATQSTESGRQSNSGHNPSKTRAALRQVMDEWAPVTRQQKNSLSDPTLTLISQALQAESAAWRLAFAKRGCSAKLLITQGYGRTYRRARRLSKRYAKQQQVQRLKARKLQRWRRRVQQVVGQMELLGDNLSESNKQTLWYLHRLERNLLRQTELRRFCEQLSEGQVQRGSLSTKAYQRALGAAQRRLATLERRGRKLAKGGFDRGATQFCNAITQEVALRRAPKPGTSQADEQRAAQQEAKDPQFGAPG